MLACMRVREREGGREGRRGGGEGEGEEGEHVCVCDETLTTVQHTDL